MSLDPALDGVINIERLTAWLDANIPEIGNGPLKTRMIAGGTSNIVVALDRGGLEVVLRRPPRQMPPDSEKAMKREATVLAALNGTDVPHPHMYGYCDDESVIGSVFYVMALVRGWSATIVAEGTTFPPPFDKGPDQHYLGYALIEGLSSLANVDYRAVGLENFGKPESFLERQVDRWEARFASYTNKYPGYEGRVIPGMDYVAEWLRERRPEMSPAGILHGDYAPSNVLFAEHPPSRINAIIDWELATIGDPLLDLGGTLLGFRDEAAPDRTPQGAYLDPTNFPTRQAMARYYGERTGRDVGKLDYYMALAMFRYACIVEYKVAEAAVGLGPASRGTWFSKVVVNLVDEARELIKLDRMH